MVVMKRKQIIVLSMAAIVAVAGYLNRSYTKEPTDSAEALGEVKLVSSTGEATEDLFSEARLEREIGRSESVAALQSIAEDGNASAESKKAAEDERLAIATMSEKENAAENLLRAKGFSDAVVYVTDGMATAVVKSNGLSESDVAKITDIVREQTGVLPEKIKIIESTGQGGA